MKQSSTQSRGNVTAESIRQSQNDSQKNTPHESQGETSVATRPTHEEIAAHAYEIYVTKGSNPGQCKQNWQQAEYDLKQQQKAIAPQAAGE
jgi:hypothetical protein